VRHETRAIGAPLQAWVNRSSPRSDSATDVFVHRPFTFVWYQNDHGEWESRGLSLVGRRHCLDYRHDCGRSVRDERRKTSVTSIARSSIPSNPEHPDLSTPLCKTEHVTVPQVATKQLYVQPFTRSITLATTP
jgi:hypothetical protein